MDLRHAVGVGLRSAHFQEALSRRADIDFVEVHAENYFAEGGASIAVLQEAASLYPISLHGTGGGLASKMPIPHAHLPKLRHLIEITGAALVSDHVSQTWFMQDGAVRHAGDLLPIAFNDASLGHLVSNVARVQDFLGRQILIENISQYLRFAQSDMPELDFLVKACERTGCALLVDINNLYVNALNAGEAQPESAVAHWLQQCPPYLVKELHLAGSTEPASGLVIDDHARPVSAPVWRLYEQAMASFPRAATLIEWDEQLPTWGRLVEEAQHARRLINQEAAYETARHTARA